MENSSYNSLTDKLIQNGILQNSNSEDNFFESMKSEIITQQSQTAPIDEIPQDNKAQENPNKTRKRINEYDLNLIKNINSLQTKPHKTPFKTLKRFIDFKQLCLNRGNSNLFELFLYKFFPKIYTAKLIKKAINKMLELNIDAKVLLDKTIPYGEKESRYEDLIKYINCANELQIKFNKL